MTKTYDALVELIAYSAPLASSIDQHFAARPRLRRVAEDILRRELGSLYPHLHLNIAQTYVLEPIATEPGQPQRYRRATLSMLLIARNSLLGNFTLLEGIHFLTDQPMQKPAPALAVSVVEVQRIINEWGPQLILAYTERLCRFWDDFNATGISRWQWLATTLKGRLANEVAKGLRDARLDAQQAACARLLIDFPDSHTRTVPGDDLLQVSLLSYLSPPGESAVTQVTHGLVIEYYLAHDQRQIVLLFTAYYGVEAFASLAAMAVVLGERELAPDEKAQGVTLRLGLRSAVGNIFELQAQAILDQQLGAIGWVADFCRGQPYGPQLLEDAVDDLGGFSMLDTSDERQHIDELRKRLPAWLSQAGSRARRAYSLHLADLALVQKQSGSKAFLEGIPTLEAFASDTLRAQITQDHPDAPLAELTDVEVHIVTTPDSLLSIVHGGQPTLQDAQISLTQFAICNLAGRPAGALFIEPRAGTTLPAWADRSGVEALITRADVGGKYLELLDRQLLSDSIEAPRREAIFCSQIAVQLPLLALQYSLQQRHGFTEEAYRAVDQVMSLGSASEAGGHPWSLKTLGFASVAQATTDGVANTYVFSPDDGHPGLHILYRPLCATPLQVFADVQTLWNAICAEGEVQDSVLEWLDDAAAARYGNGGFLSPHTTRFTQGSDFAPIQAPGPAHMVLTPVPGKLHAYLYRENAQALITLAKRRSISSANSRWLGYKALGATLVNALLPILAGPVATALWLTELIDSLDDALKAQSRGDAQAAEDWMIDLVLNIALVLLPDANEGQLRQRPSVLLDRFEPADTTRTHPALEAFEEEALGEEGEGPSPDGPEQGTEQSPPTVTVPKVDLDPHVAELFAATTQIDFSWARATHRPTIADQALLRTFAVTLAEHPGPAISHGALKDLYLTGTRLFVLLDKHFFEVEAAYGQLQIIDNTAPGRRGPWLRRDEAGRWQLDLRLRGLGGMPRSRIEAARARNRERIALLKSECATYDQALVAPLKAWNDLVPSIRAERPESQKLQLRQTFSAQASVVMDLKRNVLKVLLELRQLDPGSGLAARYPQVLKALCQILDTEITNCYKHTFGAQPQGEMYLRIMESGEITTAQWEQFNEFLQLNGRLLDRQLSLMDEFSTRRAELEQIPGYSRSSLGVPMSEALLAYPREAWMGLLFDGLGLLCVRRMRHSQAADEFIQLAAQPLSVCAQSHAALASRPQVSLNARVEVLRDLDIQYEAAQGRLRYYQESLGSLLDEPSFARLGELVVQLRGQVEQTLVPLLKQQLKLARAERRNRLKASDGLIFTRRYGLVVGKLRSRQAGTGDRFEVTDSIGERVVSTFEKDLAEGDWVEVRAAPPVLAIAPGELQARLSAAIRKGKALLPDVQARIANARKQAAKDYLPQDIETLLVQHATRLNDAGDAIERILIQNNRVDLPSEGESAETQVKLLREQAQVLIDEGLVLRTRMTLCQAPTAPRVGWLLRQGAVRIRKEGQRIALKKGGGFLQEYAVTDLEGVPLWYAHFHYAEAHGEVRAYTRAHLKTRAQRSHGLGTQKEQAAQGQAVIGILRSRIDPPLDEAYLSAV
jgi:hypothetical protein